METYLPLAEGRVNGHEMIFETINLVMKRSSNQGKTWFKTSNARSIMIPLQARKSCSSGGFGMNPEIPERRDLSFYNSRKQATKYDVRWNKGVREVWIDSVIDLREKLGKILWNITSQSSTSLNIPSSIQAMRIRPNWGATYAIQPEHAFSISKWENQEGKNLVAANHSQGNLQKSTFMEITNSWIL